MEVRDTFFFYYRMVQSRSLCTASVFAVLPCARSTELCFVQSSLTVFLGFPDIRSFVLQSSFKA